MMSSPSISALTFGISFSAAMQRLHEEAHEAELHAVLLLELSLYLLRAAMMADMSASLNVVSIAALFCASFRRRAMVWRRARHRHALLAVADHARLQRRLRGLLRGRLRARCLRSMASASDLVRRPSCRPDTAVRHIDRRLPRRCAARTAALALRAVAGLQRGLRRLRLQARAAPASALQRFGGWRSGLRARRRPCGRGCAPMPTVAPCSAMISLKYASFRRGDFDRRPCRFPARPASRPCARLSPAFFSHLATVASLTLSPRVGTTISVIVGITLAGRWLGGGWIGLGP